MISKLMGLRWFSTIVFPLMVVLMEACWIFPWFIWMGSLPVLATPRPPLTFGSAVLLLAVSQSISRFLLSRQWRLRWIRLGVVLSGLAAVFLVVRLEYGGGISLLDGEWFIRAGRIFLSSLSSPNTLVVAPFLGLFLWWRGITWGRSYVYSKDVYRSFIIGVASMVFSVIMWGISLPGMPASSIMVYAAGLFFFGLMALALSNFQVLQERMRKAGENALLFSRRWLALLFGLIGGLVLLAMAVTGVMSAEFIAVLKRMMDLAFDGLLWLIIIIAFPVGLIGQVLYYIVQFFINLILGKGLPPIPTSNVTDFGERAEKLPTQLLSPAAIAAIKWTLFALILGVVIFLLAWAVFRYRARDSESGIEEINESLWSWAGFKADLRLFFGALLNRFEGRRPAQPKARYADENDTEEIMDVREIYRRLLHQAAAVGVSRRQWETPYEFGGRLRTAVPGGSPAVAELTELYISVRYGAVRAEEKALKQANALWRMLRQLITSPGT